MNTGGEPHENQAVSVDPLLEARADGSPQPIFYGSVDESALARKLMLWGGYDGIVSFEGMLSNDFSPRNAPANSGSDISFLNSYAPAKEMATGASPCPMFRFISIPSEPYTAKLPTCLDIVHELGYEAKFTNSWHLDLDYTESPYPGNRYDFGDQIHTNGAKQYMFYKKEDLEKNVERADDIRKSIEAHENLKLYAKDGRLYYAIFHSKRRDEDGWTEPKYVYAFAVGVSPSTGNLLGVFSMVSTVDVTSGDHEPVEQEKEAQSDDGCIKFGNVPRGQPDGSPSQLFFRWKDESMLAANLMLFGDYNGIVSFEGMLPNDVLENETDSDVEFLRSYEYRDVEDENKNLPENTDLGLLWDGMASVMCHSPMFRFLSVPERPYTDRMPTGWDIIRELRNEENFSCKYDQIDLNRQVLPYPGKEHDWSDEVHTDRTKQYFFSYAKRSMEAHKKLEEYVKQNRLYYAVFHSKSTDNFRELCSKPACRYAFAVGVSPSTGQLVGLCAVTEAPIGKCHYDLEKEFYKNDEGALDDNRKPDAHPEGSPQHIFLSKKDESVLEKKLMLWGGYNGILSFDGTLTNEMRSSTGNEDTDSDIEFLLSYQVHDRMYQGNSLGPVFRFICVPNNPYVTRMPTGNEVIREMGFEKNFQGMQRGLKGSEIEYAGQSDDNCDELHTDRTKQYFFPVDGEEDGDDPWLKTETKLAKEEGEPSLIGLTIRAQKAHRELAAFVKNGHLYYGVCHAKCHYNLGFRASDTIYAFAVGVSPQSGNLLGVFSMEISRGLTC